MDNDLNTRSDLLTALQPGASGEGVWTGADEAALQPRRV
jgi:hypothetical protein